MGNNLKPCTDPTTDATIPSFKATNLNDQPSTDISSPNNLNCSACIINPLPPLETYTNLNLDEMNVRNKKWQEEKEERDKKDEKYKNVALTKDFLQQNIETQSKYEFQSIASNFLTKDIYGFDILKINLIDYGLQYKKYISSVKIHFVSKDFDDETINVLLRNSSYNLTLDTYNLIFYGDFIQNQNLLLSNNLENFIVLPQILTKNYDNVNINILNVKKLLPILNNLEIQIVVSYVEFNEFAEGCINYKYCFEQYYERNDGTWNELNICIGSGCTCVGYARNMPIKTETEEPIQEPLEEPKKVEPTETVEETGTVEPIQETAL